MRRETAAAIVREVARTKAWFPTAVFVLHVVISRMFSAYEAVPPLDIPMHLLGGLAIAYFFHGLLHVAEKHEGAALATGLVRPVLVFALVCTTTVFWEFAEYVSDHTFGTHAQLSLEDSLFDMLLGAVGGAVYAAWRVKLVDSEGDMS